jgi:RimJ/RimL family protein N-acetyltransferase
MFILETKRLIIRDMQPDDEDAFVAISQDEKYLRFYDEIDSDPNKYRQLTQLFIKQAEECPRRAYQLAIESKSTGQFIGTICLRVEDNNQASMGAGLAREHQGVGLIQEAAITLAEYGFAQLELHRIYAETISENRAAIKLCQSLGMRKEAHIKQHRHFKGRWWDTVVLAILKSEWQNNIRS